MRTHTGQNLTSNMYCDMEKAAGLTKALLVLLQDFGNFQDMEGKEREKTERLRFGRFFYRFPNGESGAGARVFMP